MASQLQGKTGDRCRPSRQARRVLNNTNLMMNDVLYPQDSGTNAICTGTLLNELRIDRSNASFGVRPRKGRGDTYFVVTYVSARSDVTTCTHCTANPSVVVTLQDCPLDYSSRLCRFSNRLLLKRFLFSWDGDRSCVRTVPRRIP